LNKHLHIVCLDVPWPADYGGAIDMMNRIREMKEAGILIHLHYFSYNERGTPKELEAFCESVHVYERKTGRKGLSPTLPYIVASRMNVELLERLNQDQHPILLEGIHCTGLLSSLDTVNRKIVVRVHNDEGIYYRELARAESSWIKKLYFRRESRLLKQFTSQLPKECVYACVSESDKDRFLHDYKLPNAVHIPTFPGWQEVDGLEGLGNLCLYHGNLSVPENEEAAIWLLRNVFNKIKLPFVIAGKKPSRKLVRLAHIYQHTCIVADPSEKELDDLIRKAHINVLPCFNKETTGIRLKLLHALFDGRHCVVNPEMVKGTGLEDACHIGATGDAIASILMQLHHHPFAEEELRLRRELLLKKFDNRKNNQAFIQYLW
jgi:hypothetical protein